MPSTVVAMKARLPFVITGLVAACATLFAAGETLQYYVRSRIWNAPFHWAGSFAENLLSSVILAALS
ncbi:MAG TPA: hypothetical protein VF057_00255, partial [Thermoanaerobaculia bacterium]